MMLPRSGGPFRIPVILGVLGSLLCVAALVREEKRRVVVDDFESHSGRSVYGTAWRLVKDSTMAGDSQVLMRVLPGGPIGSRRALLLDGISGKKFPYPFAGVALPLSVALPDSVREALGAGYHGQRGLRPVETVLSPRDLSQYRGVEFYVRGDGAAYAVDVSTAKIIDHDYFQYRFVAKPRWKKVRAPFRLFWQLGYAGGASLDLAQSFEILFIYYAQPWAARKRFHLEIDRVALY